MSSPTVAPVGVVAASGHARKDALSDGGHANTASSAVSNGAKMLAEAEGELACAAVIGATSASSEVGVRRRYVVRRTVAV